MHIMFKTYYHALAAVKKLMYRIAYGRDLSIGKGTHFRSNFSLNVNKGARLSIGTDCFFNNNCTINAHESIQIGDNSFFGPNVMIYDHDHDFRGGDLKKFVNAPVTIGSGCWIGGNTAILRGAKIGNNVVIAAGSVVSKEVPDNVVCIQKKERLFIKK